MNASALLAMPLFFGLIAGCGGIAIVDANSTGSTSSSVSTNSSESSSSSGITTSSTFSGTTTGGQLEITITAATAFVNCMPMVPKDPLRVKFSLELSNATTQPAEAVVQKASLVSGSHTTTFDVTPQTSGLVPAGVSMSVPFEKAENSASDSDGCAWCGRADPRLVLDVQVGGGQTVQVFKQLPRVDCAF